MTDNDELDTEEGEEDEDEDEDLDDDGDEDEDEDDDEDEDMELTPAKVAQDIAMCIREGLETQVSAIAEKGKILLDLDDDSRWVLVVKRRD